MSTAPWVNTGPDDAAPDALLRRVAARLPIDAIDRIWIFPTRRAARLESTVFVIATFDADPGKRRVHTAHFKATRDNRGRARIEEFVLEHALAAAPSIERAVDGVIRRLGDELTGQPRVVEIRGDRQRWDGLLADSAAGTDIDPLDEA